MVRGELIFLTLELNANTQLKCFPNSENNPGQVSDSEVELGTKLCEIAQDSKFFWGERTLEFRNKLEGNALLNTVLAWMDHDMVHHCTTAEIPCVVQ